MALHTEHPDDLEDHLGCEDVGPLIEDRAIPECSGQEAALPFAKFNGFHKMQMPC